MDPLSPPDFPPGGTPSTDPSSSTPDSPAQPSSSSQSSASSAAPTSSSTPLSSTDSSTSQSSSSAPPASSSAPSQSSTASVSSTSGASSASTPVSGPSSTPPPSSSTPPAASSTPASAPQSTFSSTYIHVSTAPDGEHVTVTDVVPVTAAAAPSTTDLSSQSAHPASKGFFANHGAVAGVFSVAGVLALILAVVLLTNAVRRRRARKFDAEIEAAAREAAHADIHLPNDDDDEFNFGARSVYTDHTHGTYSQAPLKAAEAYTMAELPAMGDPYGAAGVGSGYAGAGVGAGGAAGMAGVGGGNLNRSRSTTQPYNAFAGPQAHAATTGYNPDPYAQPTANAQMGLLEAAGIGGAQANLARAPSGAASRLVGGAPSASPSSSPEGEYAQDPYAPTAYAYPPQAQPQRQQQQTSYAQQQTYQQQQQSQEQYGQVSYGRAQYHAQQARPVSMAEDPYTGYAAAETFAAAPMTTTTTSTTTQHQQTTYQQSHAYEHDDTAPAYHADHGEYYAEEHEEAYEEHEAYGRGHAQHDDVRASVDDLDDYGYGGGRRVLKVANE